MSETFYTQAIGAEPGSTGCRASSPTSFHVTYAGDDPDGDFIELQNLTHIEIRPDNEFEENGWRDSDWTADVQDGRVRIFVSVGDDGLGWEIDHTISPETATQLADMFAKAAEAGRTQQAEIDERRKAEEERQAAELARQTRMFE